MKILDGSTANSLHFPKPIQAPLRAPDSIKLVNLKNTCGASVCWEYFHNTKDTVAADLMWSMFTLGFKMYTNEGVGIYAV